MAVGFQRTGDDGVVRIHYCRIGNQLAQDDQELLAQGRLAENSQNKRDYNRLPSFPTLADAREAFRTGKIPGLLGSWQTWRHNVIAELDDFRQDHRLRAPLEARLHRLRQVEQTARMQ